MQALVFATILGVVAAAPAPAPSPSYVAAATPVVYSPPVAYSYNTFTASYPALKTYSPYYYYPSVGKLTVPTFTLFHNFTNK